jgi:hypothetical protein
MRLEKALTLSLVTHPFILALLLQTNVLGSEAVVQVDMVPLDIPDVLRVCSDPSLEYEVIWAVGEWNRALESYGVRLRLEPAREGCAAYIQPSNTPPGKTLEGDIGIATIDIKPKNWTPGTIIPADEIRFSMFDVMNVTIWNTDNERLRRAAILHELGHVLFLTHLTDFRGFGPKPVMLDLLDPDNPPESVTELDAYLAWFTHSFCKDKACPLTLVKVPNPHVSAAVATAASAAIAAVLAVVDLGRVRKQA